jgi:hypothetical protein
MHESFLHFIWRWRLFSANNLFSSEGLPIQILHPGEWNRNAGPDFFNARIRIGETIWAGNVEIHQRASEWMQHGHSNDPAYDNVVLHVVLHDDQIILDKSGRPIPCLSLNGRIATLTLEHYQRIEKARTWIPCQEFFPSTPAIIRNSWLDRLMIERLEQRTVLIEQNLEATNNNWDEAFYRLLCRGFGLKINVEPFESLARSLPLSLLSKHRHSLFQMEALLFGQAGLLNSFHTDEYPRNLFKEYQFLRHKYSLQPLDTGQMKFLRLRPANFPSIRLAQFALLIQRSNALFSQILEAREVKSLEQLLDVSTGGYWQNHFVFDRPSAQRPKNIGRDFIHLLLINTVIPFIFYWGKLRQNETYIRLALQMLEELPAETNSILLQWETLGMKPLNAYQAQAMIHLKTQYCMPKKCLECAIGANILQQNQLQQGVINDRYSIEYAPNDQP